MGDGDRRLYGTEGDWRRNIGTEEGEWCRNKVRFGEGDGFLYNGIGEGEVRLKIGTGDGELCRRPEVVLLLDGNKGEGPLLGEIRPLVLEYMGEILRRGNIGDRSIKGDRGSLRSGDTGDLGRLSRTPKILVFESRATERSLDGVLERILSSGDLLRMDEASSALSSR